MTYKKIDEKDIKVLSSFVDQERFFVKDDIEKDFHTMS